MPDNHTHPGSADALRKALEDAQSFISGFVARTEYDTGKPWVDGNKMLKQIRAALSADAALSQGQDTVPHSVYLSAVQGRVAFRNALRDLRHHVIAVCDREIAGAEETLKLDLTPDARRSADGWLNAAKGIKIALLKPPPAKSIELPPPNQEQAQYLECVLASSDYDPSTIIGGPKTAALSQQGVVETVAVTVLAHDVIQQAAKAMQYYIEEQGWSEDYAKGYVEIVVSGKRELDWVPLAKALFEIERDPNIKGQIPSDFQNKAQRIIAKMRGHRLSEIPAAPQAQVTGKTPTENEIASIPGGLR